MGARRTKFDPRSIPGVRPAGTLASPDLNDARNVFRTNFAREFERSGLTIEDLSARTGIDLSTLRRWRRNGVSQPRHEYIEALGKVFHLGDPWSLMTGSSPPATNHLDRETNHLVDEVARQRPEVFRSFSDEDWSELYSQHGIGGPLTHEGVLSAAQRINRKRELRGKFEAILETEHFETLANLIEVLYRDTSLSPQKSSTG
jgi:transcriptional regulator with XRE-family HTH domain